MIVAMDGPAGAGKSTLAKALARRLGFLYLDTGALFRAVALLAAREGLDPSKEADRQALAHRLSQTSIGMTPTPKGSRIQLDGEDVSEAIRTPQVSRLSSQVATLPFVRKAVLEIERAILAEGDVVLEGRDTTTVVAPDADVKFFVTASPQIRAERRFEELRQKGLEVSLEETIREMKERDLQDRTRPDAPLKRAQDAVEIDTSNRSVPELVAEMIEIIEKKRHEGSCKDHGNNLQPIVT
ncbi:MAG: (d)CMP kinase [Deltaproteobacteria bacterium]|nr:MAG: (d)CMP kinase [Deltaproteobacteria bacterium]